MAEPLATLFREVLDKGLIYWKPRTERGHVAKADMIRRCEDALAAMDNPAPRQDAGQVAAPTKPEA